MHRLSRLFFLVLLAQLATAPASADPATGLTLVSRDGTRTVLSLDDLAALPQVELRVADPNGPETVFAVRRCASSPRVPARRQATRCAELR